MREGTRLRWRLAFLVTTILSFWGSHSLQQGASMATDLADAANDSASRIAYLEDAIIGLQFAQLLNIIGWFSVVMFFVTIFQRKPKPTAAAPPPS